VNSLGEQHGWLQKSSVAEKAKQGDGSLGSAALHKLSWIVSAGGSWSKT